MTLTDDAVVRDLTDRTDRAVPPMTLDADAVLVAGRRFRRRRAVARCVVGTLAVAAVAVGLTQALPSERAPQPADPDTDQGWVEVAPGVRAAAHPTSTSLADGTQALLLELRAANPVDGELAVVPSDGADAPDPYGLGTTWASRDTSIDLALVDDRAVVGRAHWAGWSTPGRVTDAERAAWGEEDGTDPSSRMALGAPTDVAPDEGFAIGVFFDDGTYVLAGLAPAGADPAALAEVTLRHPIPGTDGEPTTTLLLPTFAAPTSDGRRMFVATFDAGLDLPRFDDPFTSDLPLERIPVPMRQAATRTLSVDGLDVTITTQGLLVTTEDGPMTDVALPVTAAEQSGSRYVLESRAGWLALRPHDPSRGAVGDPGLALGFAATPVASASKSDDSSTLLGVLAGDDPPELWVSGRHVTDLDTFAVPGLDERVFLLRVTSDRPPEQWPEAHVRFGTDADGSAMEISVGPTDTAPAVWVPSGVAQVETDLGPAMELTGPGLPEGIESLLLVPDGTDETASPRVLSIHLRARTAAGPGDPLHTVRWPLETPGVPYAELDEAFDMASQGTIVGDHVYVVGAMPPGTERVVLRVDDARVDLEPFTTPLLPGRAAYVAVVDVTGLDDLPEIGVDVVGDTAGGGWLMLP